MAKMKFEISTSSGTRAHEQLDEFGEELFDIGKFPDKTKFFATVSEYMSGLNLSKAKALGNVPFIGAIARLIIADIEEELVNEWSSNFDDDYIELEDYKFNREQQDWVSNWLRKSGYPFDFRQFMILYKAM